MTRFSDQNLESLQSHSRLGPALLLYVHIVVCCLSLIYVAEFYSGYKIVRFDQSRLYAAALNIAPFALVSILFTFSRFSFGYFLGFYFYTMILGYLWLVTFSQFYYDHALATHFSFWLRLGIPRARAVHHVADQANGIPCRRGRSMILLSFILILAALIVAVGAFYNFRLVGIADIYSFRDELDFPDVAEHTQWAQRRTRCCRSHLPASSRVAIGGERRWCWLLLLLFYPITLTKLMLFAPFGCCF